MYFLLKFNNAVFLVKLLLLFEIIDDNIVDFAMPLPPASSYHLVYICYLLTLSCCLHLSLIYFSLNFFIIQIILWTQWSKLPSFHIHRDACVLQLILTKKTLFSIHFHYTVINPTWFNIKKSYFDNTWNWFRLK